MIYRNRRKTTPLSAFTTNRKTNGSDGLPKSLFGLRNCRAMTPRSEASQTKSQWAARILFTCLVALCACARHPHERRTGALLEDKITTERVETALHSAGKN